jgi:GTP-binding protein
MLMGNKSLAKTSGTPGKTQLINHFIVNEKWYLVDLPGYGYAKVSKNQRDKWQKLISNYLIQRTALTLVFVLLDSRLEPQKIDLEFIEWLGVSGIPFAMVFTKTDKLKPKELDSHLALYRETLLASWEELPTIFVSSAIDKKGKEEILSFIAEVKTTFYKNFSE